MAYSEAELRQIVAEVLSRLGKGENAAPAPEPEPAADCPECAECTGLSDVTAYSLSDVHFVPNPANPGIETIKKTTPARIGIWRTGPRYLTEPWLRFRADHAAARDAVLMEVDEMLLGEMGLFAVETRVKDKEEYLTRPDLGRRLSDEGKALIKERCKMKPQVQIVVVDGLSSTAIEANLRDFLPALMQGLKNNGLKVGTPFFVRHGRVAVMDEIGEILQPDIVVEAVGERPGLVTARSMSAYMCWRPRIGTVESDRSLISNIHDGGMPATEAGAAVAAFLKRINDNQASGTKLAAM